MKLRLATLRHLPKAYRRSRRGIRESLYAPMARQADASGGGAFAAGPLQTLGEWNCDAIVRFPASQTCYSMRA